MRCNVLYVTGEKYNIYTEGYMLRIRFFVHVRIIFVFFFLHRRTIQHKSLANCVDDWTNKTDSRESHCSFRSDKYNAVLWPVYWRLEIDFACEFSRWTTEKKKWLIIVCVYECWRSQNPFAKCNVRIYIVYSYLQWFKNRQLMIIWTDKTKQKKKSEFWGEVSLIHYYFAVDRVRLLWETNKSITAANIFGVIGHTGNNVTTGTFPHYYRISGHHRDRRRPQLIIAYRNTNAKQN